MLTRLFFFLSVLILILSSASAVAFAEDQLPEAEESSHAPEFPVIGPLTHEILLAQTKSSPPSVGQVFALRSKSAPIGIIGFVEVIGVDEQAGGMFGVTTKALKLSPLYLVQPGDHLIQLDLRTSQPLYRGHTQLLINEPWRDISSRYRPLYTQGISIGETAQTLSKNEFLIGIYGQISYGVTDKVSLGTLAPGFLLNSPNGSFKSRVFRNDTETVSWGLTATKIRDSSSTALNLSVFWDSVTSAKMTTHTMATFAVATLENAEDTVAIKAAGSSSLQTGYELLLDNWDRVLFGPSYNFELKALGGYLAYVRIWDRLHVSASLSTVDIRELKYSPKTGYVGLLEAYWRY